MDFNDNKKVTFQRTSVCCCYQLTETQTHTPLAAYLDAEVFNPQSRGIYLHFYKCTSLAQDIDGVGDQTCDCLDEVLCSAMQ